MEDTDRNEANRVPEGCADDAPREVYSRLLDENMQRLAQLKGVDRRLGLAKLAVALLAVFFLLRYVHALHGFLPLPLAAAAYCILAIVHERALTQMRTIRAVADFYERGLARLDGRWMGRGESGERFANEKHPCARDLDLFGSGSVFELLCVFRTRAGEETLAHWLLNAAAPQEVLARQAAVRELKDRTGFREALFTADNRVHLGLHPEAMVAWGERAGSLGGRSVATIAILLGISWVASLVYGIASGSYTALLLMSVANLLVNRSFSKGLESAVDAAEAATGDLDLLAEVLRILESERFDAEKLRHLAAGLESDGVLPSAAVNRLQRTAHLLEQHRNPLVAILGNFVFYTVLLTLRAERWRKRFGPSIRGWLATVGEMEALAALSCYAFEHPADAWPEFTQGAAHFEAEGLAHPLLQAEKAVRNDLKLGDGLQLIVLSGANMSGKSTFVRGIGVNAVLAQCGAPVRAVRLRMSPLVVGASICTFDSLQGGVSRFYAEIQRLKAIADLASGPVAVLFLLDELLSGTNSHDRLEGTRLVVNTLLCGGAIGMITTHDLALARLPENLAGTARNAHFADRLEGETLTFDFKLKPGVVQTSNALKLMESIGFKPAEG